MTGDKKSSGMSSNSHTRKVLTQPDLASRLNVKRTGKLISRSSKAPPNPISSPPKAAIAISNGKKDEVHRRRNPLNDILRRRSVEGTQTGSNNSSALQDVELGNASQQDEELRESDIKTAARVAELERALVIAEEEQDSLREELSSIRRRTQNDEDTIDDLRQQLSETQSDLEDDRFSSADRASQQADDDSEQITSLRYRIAQLENILDSRDALYRQRHEADLNELRTRLHVTEKESQERQQQLLSLKSSISFLTRRDLQVTDSELVASFSQLANRVRDWVITNFRRTKFHVTELPPETVEVLRSISPRYDEVETTERLALYQAIISNALVRILEEPIVVGSRTGPLAIFTQFSDDMYATSTTPEYREWRRATVRLVENNHAFQTLQQAREQTLFITAKELEHILFTLTSASLTPSAHAALISVLGAAADLQRTLVLQKARYQLLFYRDQAPDHTEYNERKMESVNADSTDEDGDMCTDRRFLFCVFPGLEKFGDEFGERANISNILLKATVCCGVG